MGKKRGNGEGSLTQRGDGRWMARFVATDGDRRTIYAKSRAEAGRKLREALKQRDDGVLVMSARRTVEQYLRAWLEVAKPNLQPTTYSRYEGLMRLQAIPEIGRVQLKALSPEHLNRLYATWAERGLSPTTLSHLHTVLHTALAQAVKWNYVPRNVTELVKKPKMAHREMAVLSRDQAQRLLETARGDRNEALYVVALSTGMRQGEILALRWKDVSLDRGTAQVVATLQPTREGLRISEPKTKSSRRQVQLTPMAIDALRRHRTAQNTERLAGGSAWEDNDLVFANAVGKPILASTLIRLSFAPLLKRAGLPRIRFHDLRHTAATLLLEQGVHPKMVSAMLGHSTIAITLDLYSHVTDTMHKDATATMQNILTGS